MVPPNLPPRLLRLCRQGGTSPPPGSPPGAPAAVLAGRFTINLFAILALGVLNSAWLLRFTDQFQTFGSLLALGGLFSWLAFVSKVLPEDHLKAMQRAVASSILDRRFTWVVCLILLSLEVFLSSFVGTLEVDGVRGAADARVQVYPPGAEPNSEGEVLPANGRLRFVRCVGWGGREFRVKASGLPEGGVCVPPWWRLWAPKKFLVPTSALRPVLLIGYDDNLINLTTRPEESYKLTLTIQRKGCKLPPCEAPFDGHALWIGCKEGEVDIPEETRQEWHKRDSYSRSLLLLPIVVETLPPKVQKDDLVKVSIVKRDGTAVSKEASLVVGSPVSVASLVQVLEVKMD